MTKSQAAVTAKCSEHVYSALIGSLLAVRAFMYYHSIAMLP